MSATRPDLPLLLQAFGFDASAHAALVATNWIRTAAWTGRSVLLLVALRGPHP